MNTIKIGIIGTGNTVSIGANHALALSQIQDVQLVGIYNRSPERSRAFIEEHNLKSTVVCASYEELLDAVDGVIISTPSNVHTPFILKAIQAKKAILVEKPIVTTYSDCSLILEALEKQPVFNMVGYALRFSYQVLALKRLIKEEMGRIFNLSITYGGLRLANPSIPFEWRMDKEISGFGALQDFGSHILDIAKYACGITIAEVSCTTQTHIQVRPLGATKKNRVENDDSAVITAVGKQGELCAFHMSRVGYDEFSLRVNGEGGLIKLSLKNDYLEFLPKKKDGGFLLSAKRIPTAEQTFMTDFIYAQAEAFIKGIQGKSVEVCTFQEACLIQKILEKAERSSVEKRALQID
ncbi:MAG TPA: Gfo/Idh/MocA family oxidoreductase [Sphaerochaeta sp.]|nr:Gfo/Idh/MocA family oxidoreductase [Sphaerochaeta sp.]